MDHSVDETTKKEVMKESVVRKTILCQTPGVGFGPLLFKQAPSIMKRMQKTLDEERKRREELDNRIHKRAVSDSETAYSVSKPGTDGGLQKLYDEIHKIERIVKGLEQVSDRLTNNEEDREEKTRIESSISHLINLKNRNMKMTQSLVQRFEI